MLSRLHAQVAPSIRKLPLRFVLVVPFVLQVVGAVALVGYFSFHSSQQAIEHLADRSMREVGDRIDEHLDQYLNTPKQINQVNLDAIELGLLDLQNLDRAGQFFPGRCRCLMLATSTTRASGATSLAWNDLTTAGC
ncbi:MAG: hypothetical protein HC895_23390 [Leptolyngbyaceae cyanobacterium SM1_3_5]|nr:hypothetical protein [Leptolyngbyaceae cyanobacterium SM1_3_5]